MNNARANDEALHFAKIILENENNNTALSKDSADAIADFIMQLAERLKELKD